MKKIQHTILLLAALWSAGSCSLLDTESQDFIDPKEYYKTEAQLQAALNGVYATLAQTSLYGAMMLGRMGLLTRRHLHHYRRHAIVALLVLAAVITPTGDPMTLAVVFVPLYLLLELSAITLPAAAATYVNPDNNIEK